MNSGKNLTFFGLFDEVSQVEIPIIQRDYAQGRESTVEVREQFLRSVRDALSRQKPLDLDFVYGSFEGTQSDQKFSLLDGQQRLTTLFLLHWYLAVKDGRLGEFQDSIQSDGQSRFTYQTRPSSSEFFDALATQPFELPDEQGESMALSQKMVDCQWFFLSWKLDPTIKSCLVMLDLINKLFGASSGFYNRLIQLQNPYITFQFLNMKDFGLSDDLYIKMNARGKTLTPFENFKAWLFGHLDKLSLILSKQDFQLKVDQDWTDIFWEDLRKPDSSDIDTQYLRFFEVVALFDACEKAESDRHSIEEASREWISSLRPKDNNISVVKFEDKDSFNKYSIEKIYNFLEFYRLHITTSGKNLFAKVISQDDYNTLAKFYAFWVFVSQFDVLNEWKGKCEEQLRKWTRVTNNLIDNTRIDDPPTFVSSIQSLKKFSVHSMKLYEALSKMESDDIEFFSIPQRNEEILKAQLILRDKSWEQLFIEFEEHKYFQGRIGFLLQYSKTKEGTYNQSAFRQYGKKASELFNRSLFDAEEFLVQRALLSIDNYLTGENLSFCKPSSGSARERNEYPQSQQRVFNNEKGIFKKLLDSLDGDIVQNLKGMINGANVNDWRQYFILYPEAILYCKEGNIRKDNGEVYLLTKTRMSSYHAELKTYVLWIELKKRNQEEQLVKLTTNANYIYVHDNTPPGLKIDNGNGTYLFITHEGKFKVSSVNDHDGQINESQDVTVPMPLQSLMDEIEQIGTTN